MKCDACQQPTWGVSILGIMPWSRVEGRPPANICNKCMDVCPCGHIGYWYDGLLTCKHGFVYTKDYVWGEKEAEVITTFVKRKWWSYLIISNSRHEKTSNNSI